MFLLILLFRIVIFLENPYQIHLKNKVFKVIQSTYKLKIRKMFLL